MALTEDQFKELPVVKVTLPLPSQDGALMIRVAYCHADRESSCIFSGLIDDDRFLAKGFQDVAEKWITFGDWEMAEYVSDKSASRDLLLQVAQCCEVARTFGGDAWIKQKDGSWRSGEEGSMGADAFLSTEALLDAFDLDFDVRWTYKDFMQRTVNWRLEEPKT